MRIDPFDEILGAGRQSVASATAELLPEDPHSKRRLLVLRSPTGGATFYIGFESTVTNTSGFAIEPGEPPLFLPLKAGAAIWVYQNSGGPKSIDFLELG